MTKYIPHPQTFDMVSSKVSPKTSNAMIASFDWLDDILDEMVSDPYSYSLFFFVVHVINNNLWGAVVTGNTILKVVLTYHLLLVEDFKD